MSYAYKVIKDNPIGFWKLDETSGTAASDSSGCGNTGTYVGTFSTRDNFAPLVMGGGVGTLITSSNSISLPATKNYYQTTITSGGFANTKTSDNDFSLEIWLYPLITTINRNTIFADDVNNIGIFYEKSNIVFRLNNEELYYHINTQNKLLHIVAVYTPTLMKIYIDGYVVASKSLTSFKFSNDTTGTFKIGSAANIADSFMVDAPSIYRYALSDAKVYAHYSSGIYHVNPLQIVNVDKGFFFSTHEQNLKKIYTYEYTSEQFTKAVTSDVYYDDNLGYMTFYKSTGAKSVVIYDSVILPSSLSIASSKVEWRGDNSVTVQMGTDGTTYPHNLTNGSYLPLYNKEGSITNGIVYFKITFATTDSSKYFPKFSRFVVKFYGTKNLYGDNSGYYITSDKEYDLASFSYPPLLRVKNDGLQTSATGGFKINFDTNINTLEFFYTPSALTASTLINNTAANLSWNGSGTLSKTNIASVYVNGIDRSAATAVSTLFNANQIHHVIIKFTTAITGDIKFNYNVTGGPSNKFNNIAAYEKALTATEIVRHYSEYIGRPASTISEQAILVTDKGINYANNDWIVISTV